jgi:hypothetical protein
MSKTLRNLTLACGLLAAGAAGAQVTLYEHDGFRGRSVTVDRQAWNLDRRGFNDEISSVVVRGGTWQLCEHAGFEGRCVTVGPGDYPSLGSIGMNDRVSSVRPAESYSYGNSYDNRPSYAYDRYGRYDRHERVWDRDRGVWVDRYWDRDRGTWVERY